MLRCVVGTERGAVRCRLLTDSFSGALIPFKRPGPRPTIIQTIGGVRTTNNEFILDAKHKCYIIDGRRLNNVHFSCTVAYGKTYIISGGNAIITRRPLAGRRVCTLISFYRSCGCPLRFGCQSTCCTCYRCSTLGDFCSSLPGDNLAYLSNRSRSHRLVSVPRTTFIIVPPRRLSHFRRGFNRLNLRFVRANNINQSN